MTDSFCCTYSAAEWFQAKWGGLSWKNGIRKYFAGVHCSCTLPRLCYVILNSYS